MNYAAALTRCIEHGHFSHEEMLSLMRDMMSGKMPEPIISALLIALRVKKETITEIVAAATAMREFATHVSTPYHEELLDMCGTGGDGSHTFNISTASMFVAAACGVKIAKHGNRSASSSSGSADVLEALGAYLDLRPEHIVDCIETLGIGFMFAPKHHASMRFVAPVRKALGVRTIFNILGPLTNPANAANQLMGVFHPDLITIQLEVLQQLGSKHVLTVHGCDGMDEATLAGDTLVGELKNNQISQYTIHPEMFNLTVASSEQLKVNNAQESAQVIHKVFNNTTGPARDIVIYNAGLAIYAANHTDNIAQGIELAREAIASGAAQHKLAQFCQFTQNKA